MHINLHMELIEKYQSVILSADYIFVNGVSFFNAYIPDIRFITSRQQYLKTDLTMQAMNSIKAYYTNRVSIKWNWGQISNLNRHEQRSLTCRLSWTHTYKKSTYQILNTSIGPWRSRFFSVNVTDPSMRPHPRCSCARARLCHEVLAQKIPHWWWHICYAYPTSYDYRPVCQYHKVLTPWVWRVRPHLWRRGQIHWLPHARGAGAPTYLVIRIYYDTKDKVCIAMPKHIESILEAAVEEMDDISQTPSDNHPFTVR